MEIVKDLFEHKRGYYDINTLPVTLGNAMYYFANNNLHNVLYFIDTSEELNGSEGIIFCKDEIYYLLDHKHHYLYKDIQSLRLKKDHKDYLGYINDQQLKHELCYEVIHALSHICDKTIILDMNDDEKIGYYVEIVLKDIKNDLYEDVVLDNKQYQTLKDLYDNLELIYTYHNQDYHLELESLLNQALLFFDELEIDSEEIDELMKIKESIDERDNQYINQAKDYYDDMMNKYSNGDTSMFDQVKSMMKMLGIKEEDLAGKSPAEIEDFLCNKFHISKEQLNKMKSKMGM